MEFLPRRQPLGKSADGHRRRLRPPVLRVRQKSLAPTVEGSGGPDNGLTELQIGILSARAVGKTRKEIAYSLGLSLKTVEYHFLRIYRYLDVSNDIELTHYAIRSGLVQLKRFPASSLLRAPGKGRRFTG